LGSFDWGANPHLKDGIGHEFKKIKHQSAQGCGERGSVTRFAQHNLMSMSAPHNDR
jgi:hypothetical protein